MSEDGGADESANEKKVVSDEHINLRVVSQDGNEVFFKIKRTTALKKLMDAYLARNSLEPDSVRFLFDGNRLKPDKTPREVGMEDHDVIDVVLQVKRQLDNMVAFIKQEADEKASEIAAKAKEDFAIEKARSVQAGKRKIAKDFDTKEKQIEVQRKIAFSNELNASRLSVLKTREEAVQKILHETLDLLADVGKPGPEYEELLQKLLVQGFIKLNEENITVVCRKEDEELVKKVLPSALDDAKRRSGNQNLSATLTSKFYLAPARSASNQGDSCSGGVLLSSFNGKILCNQTLDARLSLAYQQSLPKLREALFGKNENRKFYD